MKTILPALLGALLNLLFLSAEASTDTTYIYKVDSTTSELIPDVRRVVEYNQNCEIVKIESYDANCFGPETWCLVLTELFSNDKSKQLKREITLKHLDVNNPSIVDTTYLSDTIYNSNFQPLKIEEYYPNQGKMSLFRREMFKYNNDQLIERASINYKNNKVSFLQTRQYQYQNKKLTAEISTEENFINQTNSQWKTSYSYSSSNLIDTIYSQKLDANTNKYLPRLGYTYFVYNPDSSNMSRVVIINDTSNASLDTFLLVNYKFQNGLMVFFSQKMVQNGQISLLQRTLSYNKDGLMDTLSEFGDWDSIKNEYEHRYLAIYEYNKTQRIREQIFYTLNWDFRKREETTFAICSGLTSISNQFFNVNDKALVIYPNPNTNGVLSIKSEAHGIYQIQSLQGKIVMQGNIDDGNTEIDIEHLPKGSYLIRVNEVTKRFVKL